MLNYLNIVLHTTDLCLHELHARKVLHHQSLKSCLLFLEMTVFRPNRAMCWRGKGIVLHQFQRHCLAASIGRQELGDGHFGLLICPEVLMGNWRPIILFHCDKSSETSCVCQKQLFFPLKFGALT